MIMKNSYNIIIKQPINNRNICIGDSICEGWAIGCASLIRDGASPYRNNQPSKQVGLQYKLELATGLFWMNNGLSGTTTTYWLDIIDDYVDFFNPINMIFMNLGINDVDHAGFNIDTTKNNFLTLFGHFPEKTIINAIPYTTEGLSGDGVHQCDEMILQLNTWLQAQCVARGWAFVDYYTYSKNNWNNESKYFNFLHPAEGGYIDMANLIKDAMQTKGWI